VGIDPHKKRHAVAISASPRASSISPHARSSASEVMVAPWNSSCSRRSKWNLRGFPTLLPLGASGVVTVSEAVTGILRLVQPIRWPLCVPIRLRGGHHLMDCDVIV